MSVYITSTGMFLPGPPIAVEEVEGILGAVNGKPSSLRVQIQKANKIQTRHYAIDANQQTTHSNTQMASAAATQCLDRAFVAREKVGLLAVATTQGDHPAPGMASMVQAELGLAELEILTTHGICSSSMMALKAAEDRGELGADQRAELISQIRNLPSLINLTLDQSDSFRDVAGALAEARDILFLARGIMYPLAHEGALKLKEISYIHAEAYAAGELKHGPIALVDNKVPVVVMAPRDALFDKIISNVQEVMARKGRVILLSDQDGLTQAGEGIWQAVKMPECHDIIAPIVYAIPAQMLAYLTAVAKGTDVDQPRNLAKSVTVE